jgi:arylsulfatase
MSGHTSIYAAVHRCFGLAIAAALTVVVPCSALAAGETGRFLGATDRPRLSWPQIVRPPAGAPNVLLILTDDVGFGATSTFGGPVPTPTFDRLARRGLRYTQFHTTALCSPTRGALLTGRNPNRINLGNVVNLATGFEGFNSVMPKSAATIAQVLRDNGYATAMFGKSHITPEWEQSQAGPFDRWPTGLGFQYFYGFLNADTSMFAPSLVENTTPVEPPYDDPNYFFERDMADKAIGWIREQRALSPDRPFFVYYAPGTAHAPHHAPPDWISTFRGRFDHGWDAQRERTFAAQRELGIVPASTRLTPRPDAIPSWESRTAQQRSVAARYMEAYAAAVAFMDAQVGRIVDELETQGVLDDTLVIFVQGDNGPSAEGGLEGVMYEQSIINLVPEDLRETARTIDQIGGPMAYNNYPAGWAWALSTPFQWYKQVASHFGGTRNGMVISWPARIADVGGIRNQFHFVTDIAPTILAAARIEAPREFDGVAQLPIDGVDLSYSFGDAQAPSTRKVQAFSMMQHLGVYADGWFAGTTPLSMPWQARQRRGASDGAVRNWELYEISKDFSQSRDLARSLPGKLEQMQQIFWAEAERNHMLPIHSSYGSAQAGRPSLAAGRSVFAYGPTAVRVPEDAAPPTVGRSFRIEAVIEVPETGASGVIVAQGGRFSGYALYIDDGRPAFHYNAVPPHRATVASARALEPGRQRVEFRFAADERRAGTGGVGTILVNDVVAAQGRIGATLGRWLSHTEGLDVGRDTITPVSDRYTSPAPFTGGIVSVTITVD